MCPEACCLLLFVRYERQVVAIHCHAHPVPQSYLAQQDLLAEGVLHHALDGAAQRTRAILHVVARATDHAEGGFVHIQLYAVFGQTCANLPEQ